MTSIKFVALSDDLTSSYRAFSPDANGNLPERYISDGSGIPCRSCLTDVKQGEPYLLLAHRPFPHSQPYAETGPIFIHADNCTRYTETQSVPEMIRTRNHMIIRGYSADNRIIDGTGQMIATEMIVPAAQQLLAQDAVSYVHVRSATNTCFQCRIERRL